MCGATPPLEYCEMWVNNETDATNSESLQDWIGMQSKVPSWAQNIVTIEAAQVWAGQPVEGEKHQLKDE